ncbi:MAG: outer membrane lipoprotein-sorting protein [Bdellovibrio sp. CG12_big_fil_rev_8_21_14_0_65_39_13]|nr:MAG: outer membrane lipoprotein-sorting protein [Bdellovibrio sp. CG22_combo_CG10-13_8_21_14_all_39_27]PIQ58533.1 MAG: outer membrane lipoprotein-sorting protein [Bdellovibrio sp. CG12_big_fil_rev_8_21_14_0_65_39_13]PIR34158.1 MAG: outer membrane lipoprotein-sorting protein [Bdellovibrio sp. CG11_big_fil_rev_8_21_14_0_20_39_38]
MLKFILFFILSTNCHASEELDRFLDKLDRTHRSDSSYSTMIMTIKTPDWERTLEMQAWTKGLELFFVTILSPKKEKGISSLKKNKEMWNYFPKVNKIIKVPPSMMMGSWMGSDFTNDDLVKENTLREDYHSRFLSKKSDLYEIELIPKKETPTVWGKILLKADPVKSIPIEEIFYNERGEVVRTLKFENVKKISGRFVPMKMILEPVTKKGHMTVVEYLDLNLDAKVEDSVFTIGNLQKRR